jgi:hypothetical protein
VTARLTGSDSVDAVTVAKMSTPREDGKTTDSSLPQSCHDFDCGGAVYVCPVCFFWLSVSGQIFIGPCFSSKTIFLCHEDWQSLHIIPTEITQIGYSQTGQA